MSPTATLELELPAHALSNQKAQLQRSVIRHLLYEEHITMPEALERLSSEDQVWLVKTILCDAQKNISLIAQLTDSTTKEEYWQQYNALLGYLLPWREKWTPYHGQLIAKLRLIFRRYSPDVLTSKQLELIYVLTRRLSEEHLYREDIFSATKALNAVGIDSQLNLLASDNFLFNSYAEELGRA